MFVTTTPEIVPKLWGYEKIVVNSPLYCQKILVVVPNGNACSIHYHEKKTETFHVIKGCLNLEVYEVWHGDPIRLLQTLRLKVGDTLTLEPYTPHRFWVDDEVCEFLEASTQALDEDSIRLLNAGPLK